jgi:hypothetical protein
MPYKKCQRTNKFMGIFQTFADPGEWQPGLAATMRQKAISDLIKKQSLVEQFTSSLSFDKILAPYDIKGSIAHAKMLGKCKIISKKKAPYW